MSRLATESSPYLRQHADNPVDWWPWCDEALGVAADSGRPILLSIGYSACHWCHVMAHESFEDEATAALMNAHFVNIKVDREERPDLDQIYQTAVQLMRHGGGGWPLTVFLTPDLAPFWGGTYFPNKPRHGMPSFSQVLRHITLVWDDDSDGCVRQGAQIADLTAQATRPDGAGSGQIERDGLVELADGVMTRVDTEFGGLGRQPKFPNAANLGFLLRVGHRTGREPLVRAATHALDAMAAGGVYDQLGGGFHRYSTDRQWLVPHFEKMLYDNAALLTAYTEGWQVTGQARYVEVATETVAYLTREMTAPGGGFYSTQDADSEGEEGRFFVWDLPELEEALSPLGSDAFPLAQQLFDITSGGNFEGRTILSRVRPLSEAAARTGLTEEAAHDLLRAIRKQLLERRSERVWPGRDDKVIAAWNGQMIAALAMAGPALGQPSWTELAGAAASRCLESLRTPEGGLQRIFMEGRARFEATLDDHAFLAAGLLALYEATGGTRWLREATALTEELVDAFHDAETGGWFLASSRAQDLVARLHSTYDGSIPSGASVATDLLIRLGALTGREDWRDLARASLACHLPLASRNPAGFGFMLCAAERIAAPQTTLVLVGDEAGRHALVHAARSVFAPSLSIAHVAEDGGGAELLTDALTAGRGVLEGVATAYLCHGVTCQAPMTDPSELARQLERARAL